jgi:GH15 family glucan-1,4-alpha-glucosidase
MEAAKIGDYAAIGNGRSVALVSRRGAIDWLCWPTFDSPAIFAALLDPVRGGSWSIAPASPAAATRRYLDDTNVVQTRFETKSGVLVLTDLMSVSSEESKRTRLGPDHELLRHARCERGEVEIEIAYAPRPDYGRSVPVLDDAGRLGLRCRVGSRLLSLRGESPLTVRDGVARGRVLLRAGESTAFALTFDEGPAVLTLLGPSAQGRIDESTAWWRGWLASACYDGPYRDAVARSALVIKLLSFAPSGAVVAAPTTSLPERIGGDLNWDYRFCWLRDASFTVRALLQLGFRDEVNAFCGWLLHTTRLTRPELRILYDVYGNLPKDEDIVEELAGHRGSRPVRIRNAAAEQLQLDCYGEVIDAVAQNASHGHHADRATASMLRDFGRFVTEHWHLPDQGIWEERGPARHHTFSRALCWVALDRLRDLGRNGIVSRLDLAKLDADTARIRADVLDHAFDPKLGSYTATLGGAEVDASLLLMAWYGLEDASSARMQGTYRLIESRLRAAPGLYYRNEESRRIGEGAFGICSFWVADFLARSNRVDEACRVFETTIAHANDVGLFAEEVDPTTGDALGNFPQAYTHVGLVNAALSIQEAISRCSTRRAG